MSVAQHPASKRKDGPVASSAARRRPLAASWASTPAIRRTMQGCRGRDTRPELALRSAVHCLGMRYFVARRPIRDLRISADLVFPRRRVAVFMDGCFWHGCPEHGETPVRNAAFWISKIEANKRRDQEVDRALAAQGWRVLRFWEHTRPDEAARAVRDVVLDAVRTKRTGTRRPARRSPLPAG